MVCSLVLTQQEVSSKSILAIFFPAHSTGSNNLVGPIPSEIGNLIGLTSINLGECLMGTPFVLMVQVWCTMSVLC
jgi:hypothetical protein